MPGVQYRVGSNVPKVAPPVMKLKGALYTPRMHTPPVKPIGLASMFQRLKPAAAAKSRDQCSRRVATFHRFGAALRCRQQADANAEKRTRAEEINQS